MLVSVRSRALIERDKTMHGRTTAKPIDDCFGKLYMVARQFGALCACPQDYVLHVIAMQPIDKTMHGRPTN